MMDDLISRQKAIDALTTEYMAVGILGEQWAISQCIDAIKKLPSVQPEIILCKDCVHLEILNGGTYYARCGWHGRLFGSFGRADIRTWFCADGERKEE